ncbi:pyridoxamine 5'-phosphate oxidase family protein [Ilumatobacter sp.]|uniref:pyridoxamine 5'-phosphate oxidase family protein n=1 Tax=Ilumatobacter sp. TaxID=1967498 RepID=UPI003C6508A3
MTASTLEQTAPAFVAVAHRIVWATVATVDPTGQPRTRILHPIWEWNGDTLTGWIATGPGTPKAADLAHEPRLSITYWDPSQDVATADCDSVWESDPDLRRAGWERFASGPAPVGYDPSIIPGWESPDSEAFGILRLDPQRLRVFPGSMLLTGEGIVLTWSA